MRNQIHYLNDECGAAASEYALILSVIAVAIVVSLTGLKTAITTAINSAASAINP